MRIILDTNIWVSFLIGKRLAFLKSFFEHPDIEIYYCDELEREFIDVTHRDKIRKYVDKKQIHRVHQLMICHCQRCEIKRDCNIPIRDDKDAFLLTLCDAVQADYLISGDSDLMTLRQHNQTRILDFGSVLAIIGESI